MKQSKPTTRSQRSKRKSDHTQKGGPPLKKINKASRFYAVPSSPVEIDDQSVEDVQYIEENAELAQLIANTDINSLTRKTIKEKQPSYPRRPPNPKRAEGEEDEFLAFSDSIVEESSSSENTETGHDSDSYSDNDEIYQDLDEGSDVETTMNNHNAIDESASYIEFSTDDEKVPTSANAIFQCSVDMIPSDIESSEDDAPLDRDFNDAVIQNLITLPISSGKQQDSEEEYELEPRMNNKLQPPPQCNRLPIKMTDGRLVQTANQPIDKERQVEASENEFQAPAEIEQRIINIEDYTSMYTLETIAEICNEVICTPNQKLTKLKPLIDSIHHQVKSSNVIQAVAIASVGQVFLDIIPGYPIVQLTSDQKQERISKQVRQLRTYEQTLIVLYQRYLSILDQVIKARITTKHLQSTDPGYVAVTILTNLLTTHKEFNFHLNIANVLVKRLKSVQFRPVILDAFQLIFKRDEYGKLSSILVQLISKFIKQVNYKVAPCVVEVFESLRLKQELSLQDIEPDPKKVIFKKPRRGNTPKTGQYINKKKRKANKQTQIVQEEVKLAGAEIDAKDRKKIHCITLDHVFVTYFRVLKCTHLSSSKLILAVLKGLSCFAHLISIEYLDSLIKHFKLILNQTQQQTNDTCTVSEYTKLSIVCTVTKIMSGLGQVLYFDITEFHQFTYSVLATLSMHNHHSRAQLLQSVYETIDVSLIQGTVNTLKQLNTTLTAIFTRLVTLATTLADPGQVMASLALATHMFAKYESTLMLVLCVPSDQCVGIVYDPTAANMDQSFCLGNGNLVYQLSTLVRHWHVDVCLGARALVQAINRARVGSASKLGRTMQWDQGLKQWGWNGGIRFVPALETLNGRQGQKI